jgi:tyrosine-specific transport protein
MKKKMIFTMALLVVGNLIGAGILALPMQTGGAGLIFATLAMVVFCGAMFFSAVVLAREATDAKTDNFNYPSLYGRYLGQFGKWLAIVTNMLILYGLLTAYLTGGTAVITGIFDLPDESMFLRLAILLPIFAVLSVFAMFGTRIIASCNIYLMVILGTTFVAIVIIGLFHIKPQRELFFNIEFLPIAVPVILTAFHFHNIIPTICRHLEWDIKAVKTTMLTGMTIGLFMNFIWVAVGIGVLPLTFGEYSIVAAFKKGLPATVPISHILNMPLFNVFASVFAIVAICTSYVANGMGLMDFNRDLLKNSIGEKSVGKFILPSLTFLPPLIIAVFFPGIFLKAIGVVGGVGIAILFGILPAIIFFVKSKTIKARLLAIFIFLLFIAALCSDLANDFGIINTDAAIHKIEEKAKNHN